MFRGTRIAQPIADGYAVWRRHFPFIRGSGLLFRMLRRLEHAGLPMAIARGEEGLRVEIGTDCVTTHVLVSGAWEREQTARMRGLTQRGAVWIDVGANVGYFSMLASRWVGRTGRVYAIEPIATTRERLARNFRLNDIGDNVLVLPCACGARAGRARIAIEDDPGHAHIDRLGSEEVVITTIDDLVRDEALDRLDVLKIDTEGHDLEVLRGAREALAQFAPAVIAEVQLDGKSSNTPRRVREYLETFGYSCHVFRNEASTDLIGLPAARTFNLVAV